MLKRVAPPRARVWWNGEQWESYVPGDQHSFVSAAWQEAMNWAEFGTAMRRLF